MFFLKTSDALEVYLDGLVINFSSLLTSKSAIKALWIVPAANSLSNETTGKKEALDLIELHSLLLQES